MRLILIGNYKPDKQESMIRFAQMLKSGFIQAGVETHIWWPTVILGALATSTTSGIGKWLGYVDKWVFFPLIIKWRLLRLNQSNVRFHTCDHSNAPYLKHFPRDKSSITCHDVIAIRGGLGYADAYCKPSPTGKILQRWILKNLSKARVLAAVSELTLLQLEEVTARSPIKNKNWRVIYNAFNAEFKPIAIRKTRLLLYQAHVNAEVPFILHVGSSDPRKNRRMLLDMVHRLKDEWNGNICFAGEPVDKILLSLAKSFGIEERIISVIKPDHDTLVALYNACSAFIFPSFSEGFGWPIIEAQACGAPVIASKIAPMPEISGGAAIYADPANPEEFAKAFLCLKEVTKLSETIEQGFFNARRFSSVKMIDAYLDLYAIKPLRPKKFVSESFN